VINSLKTCAVIGAGLSGLTVAKNLHKFLDVTIYEKSLGPGGRMATRRNEPYSFDHGAQYFTAKTKYFREFVDKLFIKGCVERWDARFVEIDKGKISNNWQWGEHYPHYVGVPSMNAIAKSLTEMLKINLGIRIKSIEKASTNWELFDEEGKTLGVYDWVIIATPVANTCEILPNEISFQDTIQSIKMTPCFSLMLGFDKHISLDFDAALVRGQDISWISVNSSKPTRAKPFSLLIHSTNLWAEEHLNDDKSQVVEHLCSQLKLVTGIDARNTSHQALHTWKYANAKKRYGEPCFIDTNQQLAVCGDWLIQGNVEAAFISGLETANKIIKYIINVE